MEKTAAGGCGAGGRRVSLDPVVHADREGLSPEGPFEAYPPLAVQSTLGPLGNVPFPERNSNKRTSTMRVINYAIASLVVVLGCNARQAIPDATATTSEKKAEPLKVGDKAPAFENLAGVDGEQHSLADYRDAKAVAIVFTCNHCPVAKAYEDRLMAIDNDYNDKQVELVAINVNNLEADKLPAMKQRAEEKGFGFAYLYDPSQQIGRDFGARVTPHAFVLDEERKLAYDGPIDDSQNEEKVTNTYLRDAIDAVLAGETPAETSVKAFGCGIKYE